MLKKKSTKKKVKRPSPKLLGTGMARQAAKAVRKRHKELEKLMKDL
jgi:hypothetical protein